MDPHSSIPRRPWARRFWKNAKKTALGALFGGSDAWMRRGRTLLPNTFLQALVYRVLTGPVLPEVIEMKVYKGASASPRQCWAR